MNIDTSERSVNLSSRNGAKIEMIVIHSTEGTRKSDVPILLGQTSRKVSAHYYIQRDGKIRQFVPDSMAAWHAGVSSWQGHSAGWIQTHSIGIELENLNRSDVSIRQTYTEPQFNAVVELTRELITKYRVPSDNLVRHRDIAPVRKADPAGFDWPKFRREVFKFGIKPKAIVEPEPVPPSDTPYETTDWLDPVAEIEEKINTAAETAVSNAFSGFIESIKNAWLLFLDGLKR